MEARVHRRVSERILGLPQEPLLLTVENKSLRELEKIGLLEPSLMRERKAVS